MLASPIVLSLDRYQFATQTVGEIGPRLPSRIVYDIGAGRGPMRADVEAAGLVWHGFDSHPATPAIRRWNLDEPCPAEKSTAGLVLLMDVIEHLPNPGISLRHIAETMLPGARLVLTTPNPRWSRSRLEALRTGYPSCFTPDDLATNGHVFPVWPHILERLLADAGLAVERYCTLDGRMAWPVGKPTWRYPLRLLHAAANKIIERRDPSACGLSYAVIAAKAAGPGAPIR